MPVPVDGANHFIDLAVGAGHTCGIENSGAVICWGSNVLAEIGDGIYGPGEYALPRVVWGLGLPDLTPN
jgi:alpha-tubulin suppressor-like RCC1 family protein